MRYMFTALLAVASCASIAQAQTAGTAVAEPPLTLDRALQLAGAASPSVEAATAASQAAEAGRTVAGLRPNPEVSVTTENVAGSGTYRGFRSAETTGQLSVPLELGGKRQARIAVADAVIDRTRIGAAVTAADLRLSITQLYIQAAAAERRVVTARDQARIASEALRGARIRVQAGRASPLEEQRADVLRINAEAAVERAERLAITARGNLARRIGTGAVQSVDLDWFGRVGGIGPAVPVNAASTLELAASRADVRTANAQVRLARSQRIPNLTVFGAARRLEATNDVAAVFGVSIPLTIFNNGNAAVAQARAQQTQAEALSRVTALDVEQSIANADTEVANAATSARTAIGPSLAAAQEAARIARIGYREGKFGQLELLDAERTLAETRAAAIEALAAFHDAQARRERLTTPAPTNQDTDR